MKPFKKTTKFNFPVTPAREEVIYKDMSVIYEIEGDSINDAIIDYSDLDRLESIQRETIEGTKLKKDRVAGGRYGSVISVNEKTAWALNLIAKSRSIATNEKVSVTNVLDVFIDFATKGNLIEEDFSQTPQKNRFNKEFISETMQDLNRVIYTKMPSLNSFSAKDDFDHEFIEVYIPDITYHPVSLFSNLLLGLIRPELLGTWDFDVILALFPELGVQPEQFMVKDEDIKSKLQNTKLDFERLHAKAEIVFKKIDSMVDVKRVLLPSGRERIRTSRSTVLRWLRSKQPLEQNVLKEQSMVGSLRFKDISMFEKRFCIWQELSKKLGYYKVKSI